MTSSAHVALYRRLTKLYPRSFRRNYGTDLVALFAEQIRDERPARVWWRAVRDLAVSVPTERLEAHMKRQPAALLTGGFGVVAGAAALAALTVGTGPAMPVFAVVALLSGAVALWSWQANRPVPADRATGRSWWKVLVAGPGLAAVTVALMAVPWPDAIDLGDNAYWLVLISFLMSITLAGTGVLLGIAALVDRRRGHHLGV